ncbi:hypothetical protein CC78DRAFT_608352 [Lojkania enalia]|uniref:Uncharacterized protein n=1 Tax=Lojkania enalia TaxID=147567 RepID=A0A9P4K7B4_9PLEO|nr:hypothetical protein CC78DRAFT_608352 [Didymosphaeria enalia]
MKRKHTQCPNWGSNGSYPPLAPDKHLAANPTMNPQYNQQPPVALWPTSQFLSSSPAKHHTYQPGFHPPDQAIQNNNRRATTTPTMHQRPPRKKVHDTPRKAPQKAPNETPSPSHPKPRGRRPQNKKSATARQTCTPARGETRGSEDVGKDRYGGAGGVVLASGITTRSHRNPTRYAFTPTPSRSLTPSTRRSPSIYQESELPKAQDAIPSNLRGAKAAMGQVVWDQYVALVEAYVDREVGEEEFERGSRKLFLMGDERAGVLLRERVGEMVARGREAEGGRMLGWL